MDAGSSWPPCWDRFAPRGYSVKDYVEFEITYRCKNCGKEWTKSSEKEIDIPRRYGEDEFEKTDADASREEEEAREEEYIREER